MSENDKITIDIDQIRTDAGSKLNTDNKTQSGIINLNEGADMGIGKEFFSEKENHTKPKS